MNPDAFDKIAMLRGSMRCFYCGLAALLPVLGLPFAVAALWGSGRVRVHERRYWNAAKPYRTWGVFIASVATIFWLMVAILIAYNAISPGGGIYGFDGGGD